MRNNPWNGMPALLLLITVFMLIQLFLNLLGVPTQYDCNEAEFRPDYPRRVILACREERLKHGE